MHLICVCGGCVRGRCVCVAGVCVAGVCVVGGVHSQLTRTAQYCRFKRLKVHL